MQVRVHSILGLKMPTWCSVPGCKNTGTFRYPKDKELRLRWCIAIHREDARKKLWRPSDHGDDRVCERHFKDDDILVLPPINASQGRRVLKEGAIPSIFPFAPAKENANAAARDARARNRARITE